jgi:hypothetical protein
MMGVIEETGFHLHKMMSDEAGSSTVRHLRLLSSPGLRQAKPGLTRVERDASAGANACMRNYRCKYIMTILYRATLNELHV